MLNQNDSSRQAGFTPVALVILAAAGIIFYVLTSSTLPFKDKLFSLLYPKSSSYAQEVSLTGWKTYDEEVKAGRLKPAGKILEVTFAYDVKQTPVLKVDHMRKLNGYSSLDKSTRKDYSVKIINNQKEVIAEAPFIIPNDPIVEYPPDKIPATPPPSTKLDRVKFVVTLPWYNNGEQIQVFDSQGKLILTEKLSKAVNIENKPNFHSIRGDEFAKIYLKKTSLINFIPEALAATDDHTYLDITFIGDKYTNINDFHDDVTRVIRDGLEAIDPFKTRRAQLYFRSVDNISTDLGCGLTWGGRSTCNWDLVEATVNTAHTPFDKIVVIVNQADFRGVAGDDHIVASSNSAQAPTSVVHELGHVVGDLEDEYLTWRWPRGDRNCHLGLPPNPDWQGIVPDDSYFMECSIPIWHRSSDESIMRTSELYRYFNPISLKYMNEGIDHYTTTQQACTPGEYSAKCLKAKCGEGNWCVQEVYQCRSDGSGWDYVYPECPFDLRCGDCTNDQPAPTPTSCTETWGQCDSCSCGHPGECEVHRKTDCSQECVWDPGRCAVPTPTPTSTPISCQTITSYGSPNPVLARGTITFTFTSNGAYTNVGIQPGDSTTCGGVTVSGNGFGLGTGSNGWRWTCTAGGSGGNFSAKFVNSQNCSTTKAYTITVPTPTPTSTPISCQTITSYGSPNPVLARGTITFTFTSNGAYTNVGIQPGDSTTCGGVTVSGNGFGLGTGSNGWRWTCTAGGSGGNFSAKFVNSQNCSTTKAYTITVPTPTPTSTFTITGLTGSYYKDLTFTTLGTKNIGEIVNFNWGSGSPYLGVIPADRFSIRWTGYIKPPYSGTYTFYTKTDDGVRLYVNNQLLINKWIYQSLTEYSGVISLTAGVKYPIRMDYFEGTGNSSAQLYWKGPNISKQIIPQKYLSP